MHGLVSLQHDSRYCQRTLVATHIAKLRVSAPGRVVRWLDNSDAFSILPHPDLAVQLMLGREERGSTYIHVVVECLLQCQQLARCQLLCGGTSVKVFSTRFPAVFSSSHKSLCRRQSLRTAASPTIPFFSGRQLTDASFFAPSASSAKCISPWLLPESP